MRENRSHGSEGGEDASPSLPLSAAEPNAPPAWSDTTPHATSTTSAAARSNPRRHPLRLDLVPDAGGLGQSAVPADQLPGAVRGGGTVAVELHTAAQGRVGVARAAAESQHRMVSLPRLG